MESELGYDPEVWKRIASELGWPAVAIPEAYDGLGLGAVELTALMEEMGRVLLCAPFFSSVCLAGNALLSAGSEEQKREFLPAIAEGRTLATVAWTGPSGAPGAAGIAATVRRQGDEFVLRGAWRFVLDGLGADLLVVAARRAGSAGEEGVSLFALPSDTPGVDRCALPTMDPTRRLAEVTLRDVRVPASALMGEEGEGWRPLGQALDGAAVALAAEQVGGAQTCLDLSVAYAKERVQFGRPIGSFQAIKHKCADMMVAVESARSASYYAACVAAYFRCAAESIQIHGGVGFSWEYDVHLYFKRARSTEIFLGDPAYHRERVARHVGL
jgi:alkylation response protein AidB-like acyl-CoA dehydrogenase